MTSSPSTFMSYYDCEPPFLAIGTDVSAKYKGAFCEAKIKKVTRLVKCRVTFKNNGGSVIVTDDNVKGPLRIGAHIEAKHPDKNQYLEGTINKIIDASQYTVVFDDGDETTLRRTSLCLKSGKHFAESESLDHLPLTNPEHFGNPVNLGTVKSRRKRNVPAENEKQQQQRDDDTSTLVNGDKNGDDDINEIEEDKRSSTIPVRKGKRRGKYARKPRTSKAEIDGEDDGNGGVNNNDAVEDKSPPPDMSRPDSETESDNEYESKVPTTSKEVNNNGSMNEDKVKCELESLDASPASSSIDNHSGYAFFKTRRKKNLSLENEKREDINRQGAIENGDDDEKRSYNGTVTRKGKRRGKFGRKRTARNDEEDANGDTEEKGSAGNNDSDTESETEYDSKIPTISRDVCVEVEDRIRVKYGKGKAVKIYEAKVLLSDNDPDLMKRKYFVHYTGWNTRYDEWIKRNRIVEVVKDKVTKRKGGNKMKKGVLVHDDRHSPSKDENLSKEVSKEKDSKDNTLAATSKSISSIKRGRPSSATEGKSAESAKGFSKRGNKFLGKRKSRGDLVDQNQSLDQPARTSSSSPSLTKNTELEDDVKGNRSDNETGTSETMNENSDSNLNPEVRDVDKTSQSIPSNESICKAELEESTDIDTMEVTNEIEPSKESATNTPAIDEDVDEKLLSSNVSISDDILTCTENLAKSPAMRSDSPDLSTEINLKEEFKDEIKTENSPVSSPLATEDQSDDDEAERSARPGKRKLVKQAGKKKRARGSDNEDGEAKNVSDANVQSRKKLRKKRDVCTLEEDESRKDVKPPKKTRKSFNSTGGEPSKIVLESPTITTLSVASPGSTTNEPKDDSSANVPAKPEAENDRKGKRRRRYLGKVKQSEVSVKTGQAPVENKQGDGQVPKKRIKKELEEKKKKERDKERASDLPEQDEDESQEVASLFENTHSLGQSEEINSVDMSCNEGLHKTGGSFLLCKEEVPASPPGHQIDLIRGIRDTSSHHESCSVVEHGEHNSPSSSHFSSSHQPSALASSSSLMDGKENGDQRVSSSLGNRDCSHFTPPTTPESLKSGTLSSSTPPHEREPSDNERNQIHHHNNHNSHHLLGGPSFSSDMEVSKTTLASTISALDSLANAASGVSSLSSKKCNSPPIAHHSEDSCSRNGIFEQNNKGDKLSSVSSPISSPKKRRGRVRTSSTSETTRDTKSQTGYKTRGACGRKNKQYGDSSDIYSSNEASGGPISPAFPTLSLSDYSPNGFIYSVLPTSKYNFCTPIDENLEAEKRIQILQERLQDLRKTYMNIKSEVASIERKRKKAKKKDKDSGSPVSPSSSHHEHSNNRNPKDHPPEIIAAEALQSQTCAA